MESKVNYTAIGLFVCLLGFALVVMILWVGNLHQRQENKTYIVYMKETVAGLNVESSVKFNGVDVGKVQHIGLDPNDPQRVMLVLEVGAGVPITTSTVAKLAAQGITGLRYVALSNKTPSRTLLKPKPGKRYAVIAAEPSLLVQLDSVLREVSHNVKELTQNFNTLLTKENFKSLNQTVTNLETFTQSLADNSRQIDTTIKYALRVSRNAAMASEQLPQITEQFEKTLKSVENSAENVKLATEQATQTLQEGQVAIQGFSQQLVPRAAGSLERLQRVLQNFQQLSNQLNQDPSVLLRGVKPAAPGPGEESTS